MRSGLHLTCVWPALGVEQMKEAWGTEGISSLR
jgi:hypothetical protein